MANTLRFKRGLVATIPTALAGEPLFTTDTFDLYIGNGTGNTRFQKYIASGTTSQLLRGDGSLLTMPIVLTSPSTGQVLKFNGTNWVNDSDSGITGSGSAGQVAYFTGATTQGGSNNLFWDNTNGRLGIGTNAPSERLYLLNSSAAAGGIIDCGLGNSVSFLQLKNSAASGRAYSINVGGASSSFGSNFFIYDNTAAATRVTLFATGNFGIGTGATDGGQRLQVTGDVRITNGPLTVISPTNTEDGNILLNLSRPNSGKIFSIRDQALIEIGNNNFIHPSVSVDAVVSRSVSGLFIGQKDASISSTGIFHLTLGRPNNINNIVTSTTEQGGLVQVVGQFNPNTAVASPFTSLLVRPTINQTGGANGITRGLYIAPTLTAAADWRSIEWSNNTGWGLYGVGTANNYLAGALGIGVFASATTGGYINVQNGRAAMMGSASDPAAYWNANATFNAGWKYIANGFSSRYEQGLGAHYWFNAASGTAGNAITFTQAMTLDASGNLLVGSATSSGERLQVTGTARITGALSAVGTFNLQRSGSGADTTIQFRNEVATNRAKIVFGGTNEELGFYAGGGTTENLRIASTGIATFSNKIITQSGSDAIEIGTPTGNNYRSNIYIKATDGSAGAVNAYFGVNVFSTTGILDISNTNGISMRSGGSERLSIASTGGITIGGNLTVDTNTLFVDATNNRVGIGTASPIASLDVVGDARFSSTIAVGGTATFLNPSSVNIVGTATLVGATARNTSSASGDTQCGFYVENGTSNGQLYKAGTGYTTRKTIAANDLGFYNAAAGNISILNDFSSGSIILTAGGSSTAQWTIGANGDLTAADGENIIVGSTNGTKLGTATTQKIGFWNATPIAQPNTSVAAATHVSGIGTAVTTFDIFDGYTIGQVVKALRNAGILS